MTRTRLETTALAVAGFTALGIGACILAVPRAFYAGYGIQLGDDASLLSELRAPGAGLAGFGVLMLLGLRNRSMLPASVAAALVVFIAFPMGRIVGIALDGMPSGGIIGALLAELAIGALCLVAFRRRPWRPTSPRAAARAAG